MKVNINFYDGTYRYWENPSKRKMSALDGRLSDKAGICRVTYKPGYYNEFEFDGGGDFKFKIGPCLEPELIKDFI